MPILSTHPLFLLLLLFLESLHGFVGAHQIGEVGHVLVRLLQQVRQALVFLLVDKFTVAFFIFGLREERKLKIVHTFDPIDH